MQPIKPIRNEADYELTLQDIDRCLDATAGSPERDRLEVLTVLVDDYKVKHYPIIPPEPSRRRSWSYGQNQPFTLATRNTQPGLMPTSSSPTRVDPAAVAAVLAGVDPAPLRLVLCGGGSGGRPNTGWFPLARGGPGAAGGQGAG